MNKSKVLCEFIRYIFVGGAAFVVDVITLYLFKTKVFLELGDMEIYISTALGFFAGLIFNYVLSVTFVFKSAKEEGKGRNIFFFPFIVFKNTTSLTCGSGKLLAISRKK